MTQPTLLPRPHEQMPRHLAVAIRLGMAGLPVLPLRAGKLPIGNCPQCVATVCGGRPNMKTPGGCICPSPCHGWAAATTNPTVLTSPAWASTWRGAAGVAYHPGGAGLTVVDLDDQDAIQWARATLPATRTVATTRGEHWLYRGTMPSTNAVRPGVDIKSLMSYARWLGPGEGVTAPLPAAVCSLAVKEPPRAHRTAQCLTVPLTGRGGDCPHRTPTYLARGIAMAVQRITDARAGVHATVYQTFLAVLSTHGRCGCLTDDDMQRLFTAAHAKGETPRHCADAWTNARTALGM
ncbi:bifunctional DNA primase/polymerase [Streptomyces sp. NPDC049906]|uniref:bifunctional DNA primase/polymerase n=1 Tax=Streptomyces sp. NPDC049906 TaxID=3155656 RepID=UPI00343A6F29